MPVTEKVSSFSLLWPPDYHAICRSPRLSAACAADLDLNSTLEALSAPHGYFARIRDMLLALCDDPAAIRYRQDVFADLVELPDLARRLTELLPRLFALDSFAYAARSDQSPLHEVVWRIGQLESYVDCVRGLNAIFDGVETPVRADGLRQLHALVAAIAADETFQHLVAELPDILARVRGIASVTIGVNLDERLRPVEATLLAVNNRKFRGFSASVLSSLFGRNSDGVEWEGLAPLHSARPHHEAARALAAGVDISNPLLNPLFRDLADVLRRISRPVAAALRRYMQINIRVLADLGPEMAFYLGAVQLVEHLRAAGLPVCRPEIAPVEERACTIEAAYNVNLALRLLAREPKGIPDLCRVVITNDVAFGPEGRVFVLTGPNQGGKTTFTQAIGLAQVLAQAGLYVPGTRARISPVDNIYTHFPVQERPETEAGRLGEEAQRLNDLFAHATPYSLILLNESLASTSPGESLYLARDIVRILRRLGTRAIYATHLHDLAAGVDDLNAETPGDSTIASLVSLASEDDGEVRQTYHIIPGPPRGLSYAREIAARYGISYEQLERLLHQRGLLDGERGAG
jgi:DNA mismatch repair protein MutS